MIAGPFTPLRATAIAAVAAGIALGSACVAGAGLRASAGATSHELPRNAEAALPAPGATAARVDRGRALFMSSCSHCHGLDAHGDEGPDLHRAQVSDRYLARVIRQGIKGEMPAFASKHDSQDIADLIAFLRSLE